MTARAARRVALLACIVVVVGGTWSGPAWAQRGQEPSPRITLDRVEVGPGEPFLVTFDDFDAPFVNIVLCGNLAYRGATDCSMTAGISKETPADGSPRVVEMFAVPPPTTCPCIVRATASTGDDFAVAPLVITGHPVGPLVGVPEGPLVEVEVDAAEANEGVWNTIRSALGGPTRYEATVTVRNRTTAPLERLVLTGSVGHWIDEDAAILDLEAPESLQPGQSFSQEVVAEVSAPTVGTFTFEVVVAGAGASVSGSTSRSHQPLLLWVLVLVLVADLVFAVGRYLAKRARRRRELEEELDEESAVDPELLDPVPV